MMAKAVISPCLGFLSALCSMFFKRFLFMALFVLLTFWGQHTSASIQNRDETLHIGDSVQVIVLGENDLSGVFTVAGDGTLSMPLIGSIPAGDTTIEILKTRITARLADGYLIHPVVELKKVKQGTVYILGEIRNPGRYTFGDTINTLKAVALAGGFTYRANTEKFELLRGEAGERGEKTQIPAQEIMQDGDILIVKERLF